MVKTLSTAPAWLWFDTVDPGLSETNVSQFNWWLNTSSGKFWICLDPTIGAQAWEEVVVQGANISTGDIAVGAGSSITFSGESDLSHYEEEVTWTPIILGATDPGVGTYTSQVGYYTRIGNMLMATCQVTWTAHTGTGDLLIGNLPFGVRNLANYSPEGIVNTENMTLPGGANRTSIGHAVGGETYMRVYVPINNAANSPIQMQASGTIHATVNYLIDLS